MRHMLFVACLITIPRCLAADAQENWFQFRGPGSAGVSKARALPERWNATEKIVWRTRLCLLWHRGNVRLYSGWYAGLEPALAAA
jgi:hypothetical protein